MQFKIYKKKPKKRLRLKIKYLKILVVIGYLILAYMTWQNKTNLFNLIFPFSDNGSIIGIITEIGFYIVLLIILSLLLVQVIKVLKVPLEANKMKNKLLSIGLKNELKQTPDLVSKYPDPEMENGIIYKFRNNNISITDFNDKTLRLQTVLKAHIFRYEYAEDMKHVLVYTIPMKYVTPRLFDFCDDYLADTINMLVVGGTGTGKSYMLKILLGKIALYNQNSKITICDYKKSSFAEFEHTNSFYGYDEVPTGIRTVYKEFSERLKANDEERNKNIEVLLIDEYGALIMASEKKEAEEIKSMIAEMLFMGRSLGIRVIIGVQRAEAMYFNAGARDQFKTILALGNISKEQKQMLFSDHKDKMTENNLLGEGYLYIDGQQDLTRIKVLKIDEEQDNLIHEYVSNAMFR